MSETICWQKMAHTLSIDVPASKAARLHPGYPLETVGSLAHANSQILAQPRLGDHICLKPKPG